MKEGMIQGKIIIVDIQFIFLSLSSFPQYFYLCQVQRSVNCIPCTLSLFYNIVNDICIFTFSHRPDDDPSSPCLEPCEGEAWQALQD